MDIKKKKHKRRGGKDGKWQERKKVKKYSKYII